MIKKILLGLFLTFISIIGFSNGAYIGHYGVLQDSVYNNVYQLQINGIGNLLTQNFGLGKRIFYVNDGVYFAWSNDSKPYIYVTSNSNNPSEHSAQGYVTRYALCDYIGLESGAASPLNCNFYNYDIYSGSVTRFMSGLSEYYYYDYYGSDVPNRNAYCGGFVLCFGNKNYNKSMCFYGTNGDFKFPCSYPEFFPSYDVNLSGSVNLSPSFELINNSFLGDSPGFTLGGVLEGSNESNINNVITGDYVYSDCTWNDILIALESEGFNKYVCYGGIDNFQLYDPELSYNPIAGTGLSIAQIWANSSARAWDNFPDWFTFWEGLYLDSSDSNYNDMWSSYPAVYHTYFQLYNSYGGGLDPRTLLEYCQLRTLTGDSLNNSAGGYFKPVCETVIREKQTGLRDCRVNGTLYSGCDQNPQVAIGTNWNGVGNMSGVVVKSDGITFIQDYFNLLKSKLQTNGFVNQFSGILPGYIIVFLLGIILFRFISH